MFTKEAYDAGVEQALIDVGLLKIAGKADAATKGLKEAPSLFRRIFQPGKVKAEREALNAAAAQRAAAAEQRALEAAKASVPATDWAALRARYGLKGEGPFSKEEARKLISIRKEIGMNPTRENYMKLQEQAVNDAAAEYRSTAAANRAAKMVAPQKAADNAQLIAESNRLRKTYGLSGEGPLSATEKRTVIGRRKKLGVPPTPKNIEIANQYTNPGLPFESPVAEIAGAGIAPSAYEAAVTKPAISKLLRLKQHVLNNQLAYGAGGAGLAGVGAGAALA